MLEHALIEIGAGVDLMVLLGDSGGGSMMAACHSQSFGVTMQAAPGLKIPPALRELKTADFYVSLCAHGGLPEVLTACFDPAVADESDPFSVISDLDMYNPEHSPPYSPDFIARYRVAQVERDHRITLWCHDERSRIESLGMNDRVFYVYRTWADPWLMDASIDSSQRKVGPCYAGDWKTASYIPCGMGLTNTTRTWLSIWSLTESWCQADMHLLRVTVPSLVIQSDGDMGIFSSDAKTIYEGLGASDKYLEVIPGDHYLQKPDGARDKVADMIGSWLSHRIQR